MSSDGRKGDDLIPRSSTSSALVQAAGRQMGLVSQLNQDIDRERLVAVLKSIDSREAMSYLSGCARLDEELIEGYEDGWDFAAMSASRNVPWSVDLLDRYEDNWDWARLSGNSRLPWSIELLERYEERWYWSAIEWHLPLPWSIELLERFEAQWGWEDAAEYPQTRPLLTHRVANESTA